MSLFDYIKYSATDITNKEELFKLPEKLIQLYWDEVCPSHTSSQHRDKCWVLSCMIDQTKTYSINHHQRHFIIALKKYSKFINED